MPPAEARGAAGIWPRGRCGCPGEQPEAAELLLRVFWGDAERRRLIWERLPAEGNAVMDFHLCAVQRMLNQSWPRVGEGRGWMLRPRSPWSFRTTAALAMSPSAGRRVCFCRGRWLSTAQHLPVPPARRGGDSWELPPVGSSSGEAAAGLGYPKSGWAKSWMVLCVLTALKDQGLGFAAGPFSGGKAEL